LAYGGYGSTNWGDTRYIDQQIADAEARKAGLGAGNFRTQGEIDKQINGLKAKKAGQEFFGRMGRGAQLAQLDPATLAGMLLGDYIGNYFGRGAGKKSDSEAMKNLKNGNNGGGTTTTSQTQNPYSFDKFPTTVMEYVNQNLYDDSGRFIGGTWAAKTTPEPQFDFDANKYNFYDNLRYGNGGANINNFLPAINFLPTLAK